ncbi:hypothetical protein ACFE04_017383 [Oxalis oulophora]
MRRLILLRLRSTAAVGERDARWLVRRQQVRVFMIWVILILSQFSMVFSEETKSTKLPRKVKLLTETTAFHAPAVVSKLPSQKVKESRSSSSSKDEENQKIYEDDERIIHTGPNPLHN